MPGRETQFRPGLHPGLDASQCNDSAAGALQQLARQQASNQAFIDRLLQPAYARTDASQQPVVLMGHLVPVSSVLGMHAPPQPGQQQLAYRHAASKAASLAGGSAAGAGTTEVRSCQGMGTMASRQPSALSVCPTARSRTAS